MGIHRNPIVQIPVPATPDPPVGSPDRAGPASPENLSDLTSLAENTNPGLPRLGTVIRPSDERDSDVGHALLSPVHLSRGRVKTVPLV